jgi:hypothetical protein
LRVPTIGNLRGAQKIAGSDDEYREIVLFASLSGCAPAEIERMTVRDYNRVQHAYFRLVTEGDDGGTEAAGEKTGA